MKVQIFVDFLLEAVNAGCRGKRDLEFVFSGLSVDNTPKHIGLDGDGCGGVGHGGGRSDWL